MRLLRPPIIFLGFILMMLLYVPANGQKVALVLSGGASKGGAHLGVLRALEENQIPVDYIAGTSIGAVIGSLYASGYTVDEIEKMMLTEEFQRWASGIMDEKYIYYYRKEDPNASWISTSFNMKKKITAQLPTNIIQPYEMDFAFMELLSPSNASSGGNFDSLFIPFRCVISDIDSSHAVVMRKGVLNQAVRASMSIPFVFSPVVMNGRLVYDGGMYNNFPADVALKEFKPDVIIGSRVAERYKNPDRDDPVSQLQTMLMNRQNDTILYPKSVLIAPELPKVNLLDFSKTKELADSGYMATMAKMGKIRELVTRKTDSQAFARKREAYREKLPALLFDSVSVTGMNKFQQAYIKKILFHGRDVINIEELKHEYFRFINEGYIQDIEPRAVFEPSTGFFTLTMDVRKSNELSVEFGGNLSLGTSNEGFLELKYRYLWTKGLFFKANGYFGRFYNSVLASARMDFNSKIPWFVEASYVFNHYDYFRNTTYFFSDLTPSYIIQREYYGTASLGMPVTNKGKTLFSIDYAFTNSRYYQSNVFSRTDTADQTSFNFVAPKLLFELNSLNRKQFANSGAQLRVGISYVNGREGFLPGSTSHELPEVILNHQWFQIRVLYDNYFQTIGPLKLGIYLEGVFSNQSLFSNYTSTMIYCPAFQPLPDMQSLFLPSFRATNFAAGGLKAVVTIYKKIEFRLEGYLFQPYKEILAGETGQPPYYGPAFSDRSYLAGATLAYVSRIGPFSIGVNYYDKVQESWAFNLNFGYILFNRKALP